MFHKVRCEKYNVYYATLQTEYAWMECYMDVFSGLSSILCFQSSHKTGNPTTSLSIFDALSVAKCRLGDIVFAFNCVIPASSHAFESEKTLPLDLRTSVISRILHAMCFRNLNTDYFSGRVEQSVGLCVCLCVCLCLCAFGQLLSKKNDFSLKYFIIHLYPAYHHIIHAFILRLLQY